MVAILLVALLLAAIVATAQAVVAMLAVAMKAVVLAAVPVQTVLAPADVRALATGNPHLLQRKKLLRELFLMVLTVRQLAQFADHLSVVNR